MFETMRVHRAAALTLAMLLFTGCYRITFVDRSVTPGVEHDEWTDFFLFGLVGHERVEVSRFCPSGEVAMVRTGGNFGTGLVGVVTLGIYTPRKVYVTCGAGKRSAAAGTVRLELELDRRDRPVHVRRMSPGRSESGTPFLVDGATGVWGVRLAEEG